MSWSCLEKIVEKLKGYLKNTLYVRVFYHHQIDGACLQSLLQSNECCPIMVPCLGTRQGFMGVVAVFKDA